MKKQILTTLTDDDLVQLLVSGNIKAWDMLMIRHTDMLYRIVYTKIKQQHVSQDLHQDALIKIYELVIAGKYSSQQKFKHWISRITRNLVIDYLRKQKSTKKLFVSNSDTAVIFKMSDSDYDPKDPALVVEEKLLLAITMLPMEQQEAIHDFYFKDLLVREIVARDTVSFNTVTSRLRYARIRLRKLLD